MSAADKAAFLQIQDVVKDFDGYSIEFVQHDEGMRASLRT